MSATVADDAIRTAMRELEAEAVKLDYAANNDAYPQSPRVATKRRRANELRAAWSGLDRARASLAGATLTASEIVDAMPRDGGSVLFTWFPKPSEPRFRKVPVDAVLDVVRRAMLAASPAIPGQVLSLKAPDSATEARGEHAPSHPNEGPQ